ncbi:hypothetical protein LDENG_00219850 [Lucifuga dentata]|nr:hypothetical protein LDENG_00219850 [Lucifuga dentata]
MDTTQSNKCHVLHKVLVCRDESDIDGRELACEIRNLPSFPSDNITAMELLSFIQEKELEELHPNLWTALTG